LLLKFGIGAVANTPPPAKTLPLKLPATPLLSWNFPWDASSYQREHQHMKRPISQREKSLHNTNSKSWLCYVQFWSPIHTVKG